MKALATRTAAAPAEAIVNPLNSATEWQAPSIPSFMEEDLDRAARWPPEDPRRELPREVGEALPAILEAYEEGIAGPPRTHLARMIGTLALAFPNSKLSSAEQRLRLEIYMDGLADVPQDLLGSAMRECVRTCTFFPTVQEIRSHFEKTPTYARARSLQWRRDRTWAAQRLLKQFNEQQAARTDA